MASEHPADAPGVETLMVNVSVYMVREHLEDIPRFELLAPYQFRWYRPGDEGHWVHIHVEADKYNKITPERFEREFGQSPQELPGRMCFLCDATGEPLGTATAWFNNDYHGRPFGRVHWVAIRPSWQGRGLAKPLMTAVCNRLKDLGHERAYLATSTARIPAIGLYLKFGFVPDIRTQQDAAVWRTAALIPSLAQHLRCATS